MRMRHSHPKHRLITVIVLALFTFGSLSLAHAQGFAYATINLDNVHRLEEVISFEVITSGARGISSIAVSPDDTLVGLGMRDGTARLWSLHSRTEVFVLRRHESAVNAVAFTRDGATLVSASTDRTIRHWDVTTGQEVPNSVMGPARAAVMCLTFSPNGQWMASGSIDNLVSLWNAHTGDREKVFSGHDGAVLSVAFSPDSTILASTGVDKTVRLWDVQTRREIAVLRGARNQLMSVAFSPDRTLIAAGDRALPRSTIYLWDAFTGEPVGQIDQISGQLASMAFSPDGTLLAVGAGSGTVELWDVFSQTRVRVLATPGASRDDLVTSVTFSDDGTLLAWTSGLNRVSVGAVPLN